MATRGLGPRRPAAMPPPPSSPNGVPQPDEPVLAAPRPRRERAPKRPDTPPRKDTSGVAAKPAQGITDRDIEDAMGQVMSLPAIFFKAPTPLKCDDCAQHFAEQGPKTAKELLVLAQSHPALMAAMVKITIAVNSVEILPTIINYVGYPVIHHGPETLQPLAPLLNVPPRKPRGGVHQHGPAQASAGTSRPTAVPPPPPAAA